MPVLFFLRLYYRKKRNIACRVSQEVLVYAMRPTYSACRFYPPL